jgi:O-antigen/teichoic acid export membrane protein
MNSKNYTQLDSDFIKIFKITILVAFGIACFGKELGFLLAKKEFLGSLHLIPIFTIGYVFYQLAYAYIRNFGYSRNTQYLTIIVLVSGLTNVILNVFFIKLYGELGAAVSFTMSYMVMALLAWFINTYFVKLHSTPIKKLIFPFVIAIPFYIILYFIMSFNSTFWEILFKVILFVLFSFLLISTYWKELKKLLNEFNNNFMTF